MKKITPKINRAIRKNGPIILSAMAAMAITVYIATPFELANQQWYLLLLAGVTSVTAILLPFLGHKFKAVWAVIPTGLVILAIQVWPELLADRRNIGTLIFGLALATEALVHGLSVFHVGEFLLDLATAFIAGWWILFFRDNSINSMDTLNVIDTMNVVHIMNMINTVITLLAGFIITLMVNFHGKFTIKGTSHEKASDSNTSDTPQ